MAQPDGGQPYQFPERMSSMTIHLGFLDEPSGYPDVEAFLADKKFALAADLAEKGFPAEQIEGAVTAGRVAVAMYPEDEPVTHFFWAETEEAKGTLTGLAFQAIQACGGQDEKAPIGGNYISVGAEMGSQQLAVAALIYAREQG